VKRGATLRGLYVSASLTTGAKSEFRERRVVGVCVEKREETHHDQTKDRASKHTSASLSQNISSEGKFEEAAS